MYGTVARVRVKAGNEQEFLKMADDASSIPGFAFNHVYKLDGGNNEYILVAGFESKDAYVKNANSPEQHQRYLQYRELLESDPEWNDGEIVSAHSA